MKIWIVGAKGMLGSHFNRILRTKKTSYTMTDINADITELDLVETFVKTHHITHVINCAAYTQVDEAETEREQSYHVNVIGPQNLGIISQKHGISVIHFSTDYVFDGQASQPYKETDKCSPINYYGLSKWLGERALLNETDKACIIRTSWMFGLSGKHFVGTILRLMSEKESIRVVADQIGRPTYAQDLAEITLDLLGASGIYHFANTHQTSWFEYAQEIYRQTQKMGLPLRVKHIEGISSKEYPTPAKRPPFSTLCTEKIEMQTGKAPRSWQEALNDYLIQYQESLLQKV